jgi:prepilin-type N-terminal cleavage/methylation domain-containing protein
MNGKKGFTLIELLVVISIIALLVALLMPALNKAREQAKSSVCMTQLKQWGMIWAMYTDEYEGRFPDGVNTWQGVPLGWARGKWIAVLRDEWQKHPELLTCPSAQERPDHDKNWGGPKNTYRMPLYHGMTERERELCSYGVNCWVYSVTDTLQGRNEAWHWKRVESARGPQNIPLFADTMWRGGGPYYFSGNGGIQYKRYEAPAFNGQWGNALHPKDTAVSGGAKYEMKHFCIDRHHGGINMVFMDYSVRWTGLKALWGYKWHSNFNTQYINDLIQQGSWVWPEWMEKLPE